LHWWHRALHHCGLFPYDFCSVTCTNQYDEQQRVQQQHAETLRKAEEQAEEQRELAKAEEKRALESAERVRKAKEKRALKTAERARKAEEQRAAEEQQALEKAEEERALETKKRPFLDAIDSRPHDATAYLQLANFLVKESGFEDELKIMQSLGPDVIGGHDLPSLLTRVRALATGTRHLQARGTKARPALVQAKDAYVKALALATTTDSFALACEKVNYIFFLLLPVWDQETSRFRNEASYYAREAEKDLRKHLRKEPDDTAALEKLALCIGVYQKNSTVREQRLTSVIARTKEAQIRRQLRSDPPPQLRPPGAPDAPYPEDWVQIRELIKGRDHYRCVHCGAADVELHVHHIVPLSKAGTNEPNNLVTLCDICHHEEHSA
jgi:hypothetical protein